MVPGWLVRAVVAADLMRLVALCLSLAPFIPGCANFFAPKKNLRRADRCAQRFLARSLSTDRLCDQVPRFLSPLPLLFQGRATGKKILELVARNVLGLLASAIACFSVGVLLFEVQCISSCDWSWICLRAYRSYARFYERTKVFFCRLLRSIFNKICPGAL